MPRITPIALTKGDFLSELLGWVIHNFLRKFTFTLGLDYSVLLPSQRPCAAPEKRGRSARHLMGHVGQRRGNGGVRRDSAPLSIQIFA